LITNSVGENHYVQNVWFDLARCFIETSDNSQIQNIYQL